MFAVVVLLIESSSSGAPKKPALIASLSCEILTNHQVGHQLVVKLDSLSSSRVEKDWLNTA